MESKHKLSKGRLWTSYILQAALVLLFLMGALSNILETEDAVNGAAALGYPTASVFYLGIVLLISTLFYAIPRTRYLGALLLTGWLGGAVASHVIHKDPLTITLFPVIFGILVWISLWLRDSKLKKFFSSPGK